MAFRRFVCLLFYGRSSSNDLNNGVYRSEGFPVSYGSQRGRSLVRRCPDDGFRHAAAGYKKKYPLSLRRQCRTQRWFSGYGQPERMDWNGALRKRCSEKLGIFLCPESSYGMAVPLFHDVQTVDGSGISLYAPGFRRTPEYAIYGGSPEPGYG